MSLVLQRKRLLLVGILLAAWAWRLTGLDFQSLWRDEMDSLLFATRPLPQVLANFTRPGENGPLYFLLLRPWLWLMGHSEYALRFPSALAGVLALPWIYVWGRKLFGFQVGLLAMVLLAVNPYHLWYSQEVRMYSLLVVLIMAALWVFAWALERGGAGRWLLWLILTSVCFYIHVFGVLVIPLQGIWFLLVPRWRKRWRSYAIALAVLILPYLPLVWWQWKLLVNPNFRTGHPFVPLGQMLLILFTAQIQGIPQRYGVWGFLPVFFFLLGGIFLHRRQWRSRWLVITWWLFPPVALFVISLFSPIFTDRYLIWILPALLLFLAWGAYQVWLLNRSVALVLLLLLVGFQGWAGWKQTHVPIKSDFRAAAAYVAGHREKDEALLFLIPYIRHTYQYYDPGPYPWFEAPYANRKPDAAHLPSRMQAASAPYDGIWLIESEADFYDRKGLIRTWLEAHGTLEDEAHFTRVSVYHYRLQ
ncbi:MAG: hypothetical protein GXP38_09545 [Chloroflexi bacterium]|nr:hypothetical protein [Chloroflexota bacterium]